MSNSTPPQVAQTATQKGALKNRSGLTLIGIMGSNKNPRAMLMTSFGRTLSVKPGDSTPRGTVVGIGSNNVILKSGQRTTQLTMPD